MRTQAQAKQADHIQYLKDRALTLHPLEYRVEMNRIAKLEKENSSEIDYEQLVEDLYQYLSEDGRKYYHDIIGED